MLQQWRVWLWLSLLWMHLCVWERFTQLPTTAQRGVRFSGWNRADSNRVRPVDHILIDLKTRVHRVPHSHLPKPSLFRCFCFTMRRNVTELRAWICLELQVSYHMRNMTETDRSSSSVESDQFKGTLKHQQTFQAWLLFNTQLDLFNN